MKDTECPYCHKDQEICTDDGYGLSEGQTFTQECGDCGKTFVFTTCISISHEAYEAPCQNGEPHKMKPIRGAPTEFFEGKSRCEYCDHEEINLEINQAAMQRYFAKMEKTP